MFMLNLGKTLETFIVFKVSRIIFAENLGDEGKDSRNGGRAFFNLWV